MQHCAFVVTAERFREVEARLKSHGIDYIEAIAQIPGLFGIYFYDPNGIRLEFTCQPDDGEAPAVISCVTRTKAEARDEPATLRASRPSGSKCASPHCAGDKSGFSGVAVSVRLPTSASSFRTPLKQIVVSKIACCCTCSGSTARSPVKVELVPTSGRRETLGFQLHFVTGPHCSPVTDRQYNHYSNSERHRQACSEEPRHAATSALGRPPAHRVSAGRSRWTLSSRNRILSETSNAGSQCRS
jgi:hypothetical protein